MRASEPWVFKSNFGPDPNCGQETTDRILAAMQKKQAQHILLETELTAQINEKLKAKKMSKFA